MGRVILPPGTVGTVRGGAPAVLVGTLLMLFTGATPAPAGAAEPGRPASLARFFPSQDLVAYVEFDGLDAHSEGWRKTAAYRLLNETTTGAMLEDVVAQVAERALGTQPGLRLTGPQWLAIVEGVARGGFAFAIVRAPNEPGPSCIGLVLRGAGRGPLRASLGKVIDLDGQADAGRIVDKPGGRKVTVEGNPRSRGVAWWLEERRPRHEHRPTAGGRCHDYALPRWVSRSDATHNAIRSALVPVESAFTPVGLAFLHRAALPPLPQQAVALGLDQLERIDFRWGFEGTALMSVTRLIAPRSPARGPGAARSADV